MTEKIMQIGGRSCRVITLNTVIVGTGAAGFNAALRLKGYGQEDIAIVSEGVNMGTSRNTGSDKQTYYKLSLASSQPDSVYDMAQTLFEGGCMHGDTALIEASLSTRCFFKLVQLGVPFPHDSYGQYVGYKSIPRAFQEVLIGEWMQRNTDVRKIPYSVDSHVLNTTADFVRIYASGRDRQLLNQPPYCYNALHYLLLNDLGKENRTQNELKEIY